MHMEDRGHQFHAMEFLMYAYLQCGREADAQRLMGEVKALPKMKDMYGVGFDPQISALANYSATFALELHDWGMAESLPQLVDEELGDLAGMYFVRALGAAHLGHVKEATRDVAEMETVRTRLLEQHKDGIANAVEQDHQTALAWIAHAKGSDEEALHGLRALAARRAFYSPPPRLAGRPNPRSASPTPARPLALLDIQFHSVMFHRRGPLVHCPDLGGEVSSRFCGA